MWDYFKHLFLPQHTNNFRAKLLHLDYFALYVILLFMMSLSFKTVHKINPDILGFATDIHIEQLVTLTNQKRAEGGISPLRLDGRLSQAAAGKAQDMFSKNYWAHTGPDGTTPWDFIIGAGYTYNVAGENLAKNFSNSAGVIDAWMNSSSHRENILRSQYEDVGFAIVNGVLNGEETTLVVQMFGKRSSTVAQVPVTAQENPVPVLGLPEANPIQAQDQPTSQAAVLQQLPHPTQVTAPTINREVVLSPISAAVVKQPLFDIGTLAKQMSLGLSTLLMLVLVIDGIYVWHHKIVRVGGKTVAHLLFLFMVTGVIWFMSFGSIL